jgi:predicted enzyme related to lactoylglutathione lyase
MPRPVHFEVHAADPERAKAFYEGLFGWEITRWGEQAYWLIKTGEGPGIDGGIFPRMGPAPEPGAMTPVVAWVCTIDVPDVDAFVAKALSLGGDVAVPKMAVHGVGWLAYCKDSEGNIFGMMTADPTAA